MNFVYLGTFSVIVHWWWNEPYVHPYFGWGKTTYGMYFTQSELLGIKPIAYSTVLFSRDKQDDWSDVWLNGSGNWDDLAHWSNVDNVLR